MDSSQLDVYLDLDGIPQPVGQAWFTQRRGGPVTTVFAYSSDYLAMPKSFSIDPALELVSGNQHINAMPGAFQDSAPDRWGRNLINPNPSATRVTGIAGSTTPDEEPAGLASLAEGCRLKPDRAHQIRIEVAEAVATWRDAANNRGIKPAEITRFEDAFNTSALRAAEAE